MRGPWCAVFALQLVIACFVSRALAVQQPLLLKGECFVKYMSLQPTFKCVASIVRVGYCAGPPNFGCNAQKGFTLSLSRIVHSGASNIQASAQACCTTCKATHECTVWSWCSDVKGKQAAELCEVALASAIEAFTLYECSSGSLQTFYFWTEL